MIEVALREEGVDRNWTSYDINSENRSVALREEGVDRNVYKALQSPQRSRRPPRGGRG